MQFHSISCGREFHPLGREGSVKRADTDVKGAGGPLACSCGTAIPLSTDTFFQR